MGIGSTLSDFLLREDEADIQMPSAEGHVGYPRDLIDLDDDDLVQLAGLKLAAAERASNGNGNGNGGAHADAEHAGGSSWSRRSSAT